MTSPAPAGTAGSPTLPPEGPRAGALRSAFLQALRRRPRELVERSFTLAGRPARLRCVGRDLEQALWPALSHLESPPDGQPALEIEIWDGKATGEPCPEAARPDAGSSSWLVGEGTFLSAGEGREVGYARRHSLLWLDRRARVLAGWVEDPARLSLFERGKPFHFLLSVWHDDLGAVVVHAGLVGRRGRGVLIPGMGGAGKSTTSLLCLRHGLEYLGDDYIGVERLSDGSFIGHSLFSSTWLEPEHGRERFADLMSRAISGDAPDEDKDLVLLADRYRSRMPSRAKIAALALPRIVHRADTTFRLARKAEALLVAAPSSMLCLVPRPHPDAWQRITGLVESLPCYWLELGRDLDQVPLRVSDLLEEAAR